MLFPSTTATAAWSARVLSMVRAWGMEVDRALASLAPLYPNEWPGPPQLRAEHVFGDVAYSRTRGPALDKARLWGTDIEAILDAVSPSYFPLVVTKTAREVFEPGAGGPVLAEAITWATEIQAHVEALAPGHAILGGTYAGFAVDFLTQRTALRSTDYGSVAVSTPGAEFTFVRATAGTYLDSDGVIKSASSGVLRYGFDPVTLRPRGALIEPQSTNLDDNSAALGTMSMVAASSSNNATAAPDGTSTADALIEDGTTGAHGAFRSYIVVANTPHTISLFLKYTTGRAKGSIAWFISGSTSGVHVTYDLIAGTIGTPTAVGSGTLIGAGIQAYPNGWYRVWLSGILDASTTTGFVVMAMADSGGVESYAGDGTSGVFVWGRQVEAHPEPTSYIPTSGSTVARNGDVLTKLVSGLPWSATQGTLFASTQRRVTTYSTLFPTMAIVHDGSTNNRIQVTNSGSLNDARMAIFESGGGGVGAQLFVPLTADLVVRSAIAWQGNADCAGVAQGGTVVTDTSYTLPTVTTLQIGGNSGGNAVTYLGGHVRRVAWWPRRLSNTELQALTAA